MDAIGKSIRRNEDKNRKRLRADIKSRAAGSPAGGRSSGT